MSCGDRGGAGLTRILKLQDFGRLIDADLEIHKGAETKTQTANHEK
jgi:hypothetical protein